MTFISREVIEARARDLWHRHALEPGFDAERLLDDLDLDLLWGRWRTSMVVRCWGNWSRRSASWF